MKNFYVYEMIDDFEININSRKYKKGERFIGWENESFACFNLLETVDFINLDFVKRIHKIKFEKVE